MVSDTWLSLLAARHIRGPNHKKTTLSVSMERGKKEDLEFILDITGDSYHDICNAALDAYMQKYAGDLLKKRILADISKSLKGLELIKKGEKEIGSIIRNKAKAYLLDRIYKFNYRLGDGADLESGEIITPHELGDMIESAMKQYKVELLTCVEIIGERVEKLKTNPLVKQAYRDALDIYLRENKGIETAADLEGRRIKGLQVLREMVSEWGQLYKPIDRDLGELRDMIEPKNGESLGQAMEPGGEPQEQPQEQPQDEAQEQPQEQPQDEAQDGQEPRDQKPVQDELLTKDKAVQNKIRHLMGQKKKINENIKKKGYVSSKDKKELGRVDQALYNIRVSELEKKHVKGHEEKIEGQAQEPGQVQESPGEPARAPGVDPVQAVIRRKSARDDQGQGEPGPGSIDEALALAGSVEVKETGGGRQRLKRRA